MKVPYRAKPPGAVRIGLSGFAYAPGRARLASIPAARHLFGQVRVANHAQRGGIDEVNVQPHISANAASDRRSAYSRKSSWSVSLFTQWKSSRRGANQTGNFRPIHDLN